MVEKPVVIVGGGIAGLSVAKTLIDSGIRCTIVERGPALGGHVRTWGCMATDQCQRCFCCLIEDLIRDVSASELADVLTGWELSSTGLSGEDGKHVCLKEIGTGREVRAGTTALVFATGFEPYNPQEQILLGHGRLEGVYTLAEIDGLLHRDMLSTFTGGATDLRVAFFQCVGSRDASSGANYCSQYCCKAALRMALKLIHECPGIAVTLFYIDLQVAGKYGHELMKKAEQMNVRLCQGVPGEITPGDGNELDVIVERHGRNAKESFDRVILSIGQRSSSQTTALANRLCLPVNEFAFLEARELLDNSRMAVPGFYLAGTCSGPMDIGQTLEHAGQTAAVLIEDIQRGVLR